jgi:hypothetical protein
VRELKKLKWANWGREMGRFACDKCGYIAGALGIVIPYTEEGLCEDCLVDINLFESRASSSHFD